MGQWLSIPMVVVGAVLWDAARSLRGRRRFYSLSLRRVYIPETLVKPVRDPRSLAWQAIARLEKR